MSEQRTNRRFRDTSEDDIRDPELNPYFRLHRTFGPEIVTAEQASGLRGNWSSLFGREAPLHVEIGPGNGFFISGMAARHPEWNWLAIEIRYKRVVLCAKKVRAAGVTNARIVRYDAWWLEDIFGPDEIDGLYINFPDPWKKGRHEKKRLMGHPVVMNWIAQSLKPGALIRSKTDHRPNLDRFEAALDGLPIAVLARADDIRLNGTPWPSDDDVVTNYQSKFDIKDEPVYALLAQKTAE